MSADQSAPADRPAIEVADLRMNYGSTAVLHGVTFEVARGEVVALLGPNGAGKTTTIEILEGFRMRSAGDVRVLGTDPAHGGEAWRARLGVVLQSWRDHAKWPVREFVAHYGSLYGPYSTERFPRPRDVDELLGAVGLTEQADRRVGQLSGGQRRRLDVAIGIVGRPEVLFLDEPTVGFDPEARQEFHELVRRLAEVDGTTILLTTHDLDEAEKLAARIVILAKGRIVADATPEELARRVESSAEVRWMHDNERFVTSTRTPTRFVRELFDRHGAGIDKLEVRRATLEDTYLAMVHAVESGRDGGLPELGGAREAGRPVAEVSS
ncbi:ABC transporter ATP-binding protein [Streptomyces sp. DSM 15324]|uniref:ABC transporter ATP-binding protein n=1 Tax=Streptomyces sp. DSM 15324 TaxID=1739111 RepID=UPI00074621C3|nr:ABC transporter ATP-binding protein [Streptomyces sp. DSM 15324]KUO05699.1 multidrug ABC transporter ATP-binding protein [Streptomyces sp. DSM 15324]